ncbi:MAG: hypothetical protein ACI8TP_000213 [Acidimicrobiales bacterium]|jgi:hypothetical protein
MSTKSPMLAEGLNVIVKKDCPTCVTIEPVLADLVARGVTVTIYTQDEPAFPAIDGVVDDTQLAVSWHHDVETVPTVISVADGIETDRIVGWERSQWEAFTGEDGLGPDIAGYAPGCGSMSVDPDRVDELAVRFGETTLRGRRVEFSASEDEVEAMYDRGWSDGLPIVAPTEERVARMLEGTTRAPDEVVAIVPPTLVEATVEQVAINAVMAGCRPEYLPVVLAAVESACTDQFNMHGLLCTLWFSGPIVIVNGPIRNEIGMNTGKNALGQGNRANSTIGRALQLVVRNIGDGKPGVGGIDRSALGAPSKVGWCFGEDEENLPDGWPSLSVERGFAPDQSTVTLFAGHGPSGAVDQTSRTPEDLLASLAGRLIATGHPHQPSEAMLVMTPEHMRVFAEAGWTKQQFHDGLDPLLMLDPTIARAGIGGGESGKAIRKFRRGHPLVVRAGGNAGAFSAIIEGWVGGRMGSEPITAEIRP